MDNGGWGALLIWAARKTSQQYNPRMNAVSTRQRSAAHACHDHDGGRGRPRRRRSRQRSTHEHGVSKSNSIGPCLCCLGAGQSSGGFGNGEYGLLRYAPIAALLQFLTVELIEVPCDFEWDLYQCHWPTLRRWVLVVQNS